MKLIILITLVFTNFVSLQIIHTIKQPHPRLIYNLKIYTMKRKLLNIFTISAIITTIGFLMDGDVKEPNMTMRFTEFFAMMTMLFLAISAIYLPIHSFTKKLQRVRQ